MDIFEVANIIEKSGGRLYLVGGAVRDSILNKPIYDEDYCVTGITHEQFIKIFPQAHLRGKSFEVFDIKGKEFALARTETKIGQGHKNFEITTNENIPIEQDLKRRDLTINSIAKDVLTERIIDPFNGINDIKNKIIRATSSKFSEDPLRVYRAARFAAQLEFKIEDNTLDLMNKLKSELNTLSKERIFVELKKALLSNKPSLFFDNLKKANVLDIHFKEIYNLIGAKQPIKYHPEGDSYNHTMLALDNCASITQELLIRYATLVHDLGKGTTPKEIYPHHYGHGERGVEQVKNLSNRINAPTAWKKAGITSCEEHMRGGIFFEMSPEKQISFIERVNKSILGIEGLQIVVYSDRCRNCEKIINKEYNFTEIGRQIINKIDGEYIKKKYNVESGTRFGEKLHEERICYLKKLLQNKNC